MVAAESGSEIQPTLARQLDWSLLESCQDHQLLKPR